LRLILALLSVSVLHAEKIYLFGDHTKSVPCTVVGITDGWIGGTCAPFDHYPVLWRIGDLSRYSGEELPYDVPIYLSPPNWNDSVGTFLLDIDEDGNLLAHPLGPDLGHSAYGVSNVSQVPPSADGFAFLSWTEIPDTSSWTHMPQQCNAAGNCLGKDDVGLYYTYDAALVAPEPGTWIGLVLGIATMVARRRAATPSLRWPAGRSYRSR
jgi:hypothetical protein